MRPIDADDMKKHIEGSSDDGIKTIIEWIDNQPTIEPPKMTGWICPVCGRGLSPYTYVCPCNDIGKGWEVTC